MKKLSVLGILLLCFMLTAGSCNPVEYDSSSSASTSQSQSNSAQSRSNSTQSQSASEVPKDPSGEEEKYLSILCATLGADYLEGRSTMRSTDDDGGEYIEGTYCAVYAIGTNKPEQFVVEEWFAVSTGADATVYEYDVVMDTWSVYRSENEEFAQSDDVEIANCIYMLNEYLRDEFAAEYCDVPEGGKQAVFKEDVSGTCDYTDSPDELIGRSEEIPEGYYADQLERDYYPVYNFDSFDSVIAHFSNYFTENAMVEIKNHLSYEFSEIDGTLYLVRGGRGYGAISLDFDTIDTSRFADDSIVMVDSLFFDEKDVAYRVTFAYEDAVWKIDHFE